MESYTFLSMRAQVRLQSLRKSSSEESTGALPDGVTAGLAGEPSVDAEASGDVAVTGLLSQVRFLRSPRFLLLYQP